MPWVMRKRDFSVSGGFEISRSKVSFVQATSPFPAARRRRIGASRRSATALLALLPLGRRRLRSIAVLGRLRDHAAAVVEALAAGAAGDLLEVAHREDLHLLAVELGELGEEHGADRDVDPDAERVGAADHLEHPLLRQLLDQQPVLGQQPGVVDADAERQEAADLLAVGGVEAEVAELAARIASRSSREVESACW